MADDNEFDEVLDLTDKARGSVSENIGKMQQLITRGEEFKKVAKYFDTVQEWSTEEGRAFFQLMEHIKHACDSYGDVLGGAHKYVICAKSFAKDTVVFTTEVQAEDLTEPEDIEDLFGDFKDSVDKMRESNKQVDTLKEEFKTVLRKLRDAQAEAAGGKVRGKENASTSNTYAGLSSFGAIGAFGATLVTGGAAAPFFLGACGMAWKFSKDAIRRLFGSLTTSDDSSIQDKHEEWAKTFDVVLRQLDDVFYILDSISNECTKALDELSHSSDEIMDKFKNRTSQKNLKITGPFKRKCIRLREESATLEETCIEYIKKDAEIRGIAGAMTRLGIE